MRAHMMPVAFALSLLGCSSRISGVVVNAAQVSDGRMLMRSCDLVQDTVFGFAWGLGFASGPFAFENCRWATAHVITPQQADSFTASGSDETGP